MITELSIGKIKLNATPRFAYPAHRQTALAALGGGRTVSSTGRHTQFVRTALEPPSNL